MPEKKLFVFKSDISKPAKFVLFEGPDPIGIIYDAANAQRVVDALNFWEKRLKIQP